MTAYLIRLMVFLLVLLLPNASHGQLVREHDAQSLRSFNGSVSQIRRSFQSDAEAHDVLRQVLAAAGLAGMEDRIILRASAETDNAEAAIENNERYIFYNAVFMQDLAKQTKDYWPMVAVLAHELGHHIRFHTVIPGREHEFELEADYQAGFILRRMGANLEQAQAVYRTFPEAATASHPGRAQRLQAVTVGWTDGGSSRAPSWAQRPEVTIATPPPKAPVSASQAKPALSPSIESGLVGHWSLDSAHIKWTSATTGIAYDRTGKNHGTLRGMERGASEIIGRVGEAFEFNGSTSYIMNLRPTLPRIESAITMSAWLNTKTLSHSHSAVVLNDARPGGLARSALQLSLQNATFAVSAAGGGMIIDSRVSPVLNSWYLVTLTFDGVTNRIYVNGTEKANNETVHQSGATSAFWIGTYNGAQELWAGSIDDVRMYDRALSASEVRLLFKMAPAR